MPTRLPPRPAPPLPDWRRALRALREARGVTQDGWAAILGVGTRTVQRWERGGAVPDATAEAALLDACEAQGLFHRCPWGLLAGQPLTRAGLARLLAAARQHRAEAGGAWDAGGVPLRAGARQPPYGPLTALIGRDAEFAAVLELLGTSRLLTLTGPGGSGKTRLAQAVADHHATADPTRVAFVALGAIADPRLVLPAIGHALGLPERGAHAPLAILAAALRERPLLLVLDNLEQVVTVGPDLVELLGACPALTLLVTSRAPLHVRGERILPVPPLAVPDATLPAALDALARIPAVRLFCARAQDAHPAFALAPENAAAVAELCRRLDGLPLALELTAPLLRLFSPQALLARFDGPFPLRVAGPQDLPARQRTLRDTIGWSYDLLRAAERTLFRRLAVFPGSASLEAVEAVCEGGGMLSGDAVLRLGALVDYGLVRRDDGSGPEPRLRMLETVRAFAREQLAASGEAEAVRAAHAAYYLALAEEADRHRAGAQRRHWHDRLEAEHDNLRAALAWSAEAGETELELRLATTLLWFWLRRGHWREGRRALEAAAERAAAASTTPKSGTSASGLDRLRARALAAAGTVAWYQGDFIAARHFLERAADLAGALDEREPLAVALRFLGLTAFYQGDHAAARPLLARSVALLREHGDRWLLADALFVLGDALVAANAERAAALYEESLSHYRALDDPFAAQPLTSLGSLALRRGDTATARALLTEALRLRRPEPDSMQLAVSLAALGEVARCEDALEEARALFEEALLLSREHGHAPGVAWALSSLGHIASQHGKSRHAAQLLHESLGLARELDQKARIAACLVGLAGVAGSDGRHAAAAQLLGAAQALCDAVGAPLEPADQRAYDRHLAAACRALGADTHALAWTAGHTLGAAAVLDEAPASKGTCAPKRPSTAH